LANISENYGNTKRLSIPNHNIPSNALTLTVQK